MSLNLGRYLHKWNIIIIFLAALFVVISIVVAKDYVFANWPSIVIGAIVTLISLIITNNYAISAENERFKQAQNEILDILENRIINNQELSESKIKRLLNAVARENQIQASQFESLISIIETLELRFENSKHLSPDQKSKYSQKIEKIISDMEHGDVDLLISTNYGDIIENIKNLINSNQQKEALKSLDLLKYQNGKSTNNLQYSRTFKHYIPFFLTIYIALALIIYLIYFFSRQHISFTEINPLLIVIYGIFLISIIWVYLFRKKRFL